MADKKNKTELSSYRQAIQMNLRAENLAKKVSEVFSFDSSLFRLYRFGTLCDNLAFCADYQ